jgi:hypothetical protein
VLCRVRRGFTLHLPSALPHRPVTMRFHAGATVDVPADVLGHWYVKANLASGNLIPYAPPAAEEPAENSASK